MTFTERTITTRGGHEVDIDVDEHGIVIDAYVSGDQRDTHTMRVLFPNRSDRNPLFWHTNKPSYIVGWLRRHAVDPSELEDIQS